MWAEAPREEMRLSNVHSHSNLRRSRLILTLLFAFLFILSACRPAEEPDPIPMPTIVSEVLTAVATNNPPATATVLPTATALPTETAVSPTATASPSPTETSTPEPQPTDTMAPPTPSMLLGSDLAIVPNRVHIYPAPQLVDGDVATFHFVVRVPGEVNPDHVVSRLVINGQVLQEKRGLPARNFGGEISGVFEWAWNTTGQTGVHQIELILDPDDLIQVGDENPDNNRYAAAVAVRPLTSLPTVQQNASWITRESQYATLHAVSGTAAARDLAALAALTDEAIATAAANLAEEPRRIFDFYFVDRVIGQGGYALGGSVISYLDRNYAGGDLREVLIHETVHLLDQQFAGRSRLPFLSEGVAVWAAGGHYKPEDLQARARALRDSGLYLPLAGLIDDFYPVQHEIGYLEAGALIDYLVTRFGWPAVKAFYMDVQTAGYATPSAAVDAGFQAHFGRSLRQIEGEWLLFLDALPFDRAALIDFNTTIRFYNIMRHYQLAYDPTANFRIAWLPAPTELLNRGLTADVSRHPTEEINIILETMLTEADQAFRAGDYPGGEAILASVDRVITTGTFSDPLSQTYRDIIHQATEWGFEVHRLKLEGNRATAQVTNPYSPALFAVDFARGDGGWTLLR